MKWIDTREKLKLHRTVWFSHAIPLCLFLVFGLTTLIILGSNNLNIDYLILMLGVLLAFLLILGLLWAWWFGRKTMQPFHRLAAALKACSQGDCSTRLPMDLSNDMGLSAHFNHFMDQMNAYSDKLKVEIHERQLTERALKESQALFDVFMAHLPALAIIKDDQGKYLYVNAACRTLLKMAPEQVVGVTDADLWPESYAEQIILHDQEVRQHHKVLSAIEKIPVEETVRYHLVTKFPIPNNGGPPMLAAIAFDITDKVEAEKDKVQLEQQLMQAQKMEAIGTLAGGIAHDFNNVLAAILGYAELAQLNAGQGEKVTTELDQVLKATHRAKELVHQILSFSRKTEIERQPVDPGPLIKEALKLLRASLPTTIDIQSHLNGDGGRIMVNATQFHQVVMNLCTNASHAMDAHGGALAVGLRKRNLVGSEATAKGLAPGCYLELSIRDTGHGIAPALQERIFDPYFTTKSQGKGTGMGLAVVHSIVKSHGGIIAVESQPGQGACFRLLFPITEAAARAASHQVDKLPRGDESVLFVDDETSLVDLVQQMLARLGYRVTSCSSPMVALKKVKQAPMAYDLVITDMTMPQMTGDELAAHLASVRPDLPVVLCTGYSEKISSDQIEKLGLAAFIMKPVTISDLASVVRSVLDRHDDCSGAQASSG